VKVALMADVAAAHSISGTDDVSAQAQALDESSGGWVPVNEGPRSGLADPSITSVGVDNATESTRGLEDANAGIWPLIGDVHGNGQARDPASDHNDRSHAFPPLIQVYSAAGLAERLYT
jgi:hypothetical protein